MAIRAATEDEQQAFIDRMAEPAKVASQLTGISIETIMGQWAMESSWGLHPITTTGNNLGGVKAGTWAKTRPDETVVNPLDKERYRSYPSDKAFARSWATETTSVTKALESLRASGKLGNHRAEALALQKAGYGLPTGASYSTRLNGVRDSVMTFANAKEVAHRSNVQQKGFDDTIGQVQPGGYLPDLTPSLATPQQQQAGVWSDRFDAPQAPAPYSPANLDFGPDFTSPPSQARGPVENPYGFSNINTAQEAAPGSFAGYGPNAFGALDPVPLGDVAPPDVPAVPDIMGQFDPTNMMTEEQAIEHAGFAGQRPSENVSIQNRPYGETVDEQIARNAGTMAINDRIAASTSTNFAPVGAGPVNLGAFTTNPYAPAPPAPTEDVGIWGAGNKFSDTFYSTDKATPSFRNFEERPSLSLASLGIFSPGPMGMGEWMGVNLPRDYSAISAGMHPEAVFEAVRNAPTTPSAMTIENFNAIFGNMPDDATGSVRGSRSAPAAAAFSPAVNAPQVGGPYGFSSLQSLAPAPDAATIPNDVTGYGAGGAFSSRAPSPGFDFAGIVNDTPWSGPSPNVPAAAAQPVEAPPAPSPGFNVSDVLNDTRWSGGYTPDVFQNTPLGIGQGIIDQGPYSSPIGGLGKSFSPANLGNPMPNSTAVATQAPTIIGYEPGKTITRDVPNPAWSDWSRDYATRNASQNAWAAADEDKFGWDRAPPNPSVLANTAWAFPDEPPKTTPATRQTPPTPIYSNPVVAAPASRPAVSAVPAQAPLPSTWTPGMTQQAQNFTSLLGSIGGYGLQGVQGTFDTGFNLAGLGYGGGTGAWGGGYSDSGYGGYGGISPGDAGYGSDARSGTGNMGAGNLYQ
jgi:hypothetical protein